MKYIHFQNAQQNTSLADLLHDEIIKIRFKTVLLFEKPLSI